MTPVGYENTLEGGGLWLVCSLGFNVVLAGELENRRRWGDLGFGGSQDCIAVPCPPRRPGSAGGGPVQVLAGRQHLGALVGCVVLHGKVADPGSGVWMLTSSIALTTESALVNGGVP